MTHPQYKYIMDLVKKVELEPEHHEWLDANLPWGPVETETHNQWVNIGLIDKPKASKVIDQLKLRPSRRQAPALKEPLPDVPAGYYAIDHKDTLMFYRVTRPTEGKWIGWCFVDVQASAEFYPIKNLDEKRAILQAILDSPPRAAAERYGQEIGNCGICGRTLTNQESREVGIGPICRARAEW